jgi:hypothetical protein
VLFKFSLVHYKVESSISPLVRETRLFPAGVDCRVCCDRFISPDEPEGSQAGIRENRLKNAGE